MALAVTYFALKPLPVGDEIREPGELIPEACDWQYLSGYISDGKIAPVLVATLPKSARDALAEWEQDMLDLAETRAAERAAAEQAALDEAAALAAESNEITIPDDTEEFDDDEDFADDNEEEKVLV